VLSRSPLAIDRERANCLLADHGHAVHNYSGSECIDREREHTESTVRDHAGSDREREQEHSEREQERTGYERERTEREREHAERDQEHAERDQEHAEREQDLERAKENARRIVESRKSLVKPEPGFDEPSVIVRVRHPLKGSLTRLFLEDQCMINAYFWIGSVLESPLFFILKDCCNKDCYQHAINMSRDGDVIFKDFALFSGNGDKINDASGPLGSDNDQPNPRSVINQPNPVSVINQPNSVSVRDQPNPDQRSRLTEIRDQSLQNLSEEGILWKVDRSNVFNSLNEFYEQNQPEIFRNVLIKFKNETAEGNGVVKEAYSLFYEELSRRWEGAEETVPSITEVNTDIIGKIIEHAFILFGIFPRVISYASLKFYFYNQLNEEELLASFYKFLPEREGNLFEHFDASPETVRACMDVLTEYRIYALPTTNNIRERNLKAARISMIQSPCFQFQNLVRSMPLFRNQMDARLFEYLHISQSPTTENVIESIIADEETPQTFLRFVTSVSSITRARIKVMFLDQPERHLRPQPQTCFSILRLPRQYSCFSELRNNFNFYIQNGNSATDAAWEMHD